MRVQLLFCSGSADPEGTVETCRSLLVELLASAIMPMLSGQGCVNSALLPHTCAGNIPVRNQTTHPFFLLCFAVQVQQALQEAARGRTVMVIAHRLSTVSGADLVAVVQSGQIIESGTHASLMAEGGAYSQLVQRQVFAGGGEGAQASVLPAHAGPEVQVEALVLADSPMQVTAAGSGVLPGGREVPVPSVSDTSASEVLPAPAAAVAAAAGASVAAVTGNGTVSDACEQPPQDPAPTAALPDAAATSSGEATAAGTSTATNASSQPAPASAGCSHVTTGSTSGSSTAQEGPSTAQPSGSAAPPAGNAAAAGNTAASAGAGAGGRGKKGGKGGRKKK